MYCCYKEEEKTGRIYKNNIVELTPYFVHIFVNFGLDLEFRLHDIVPIQVPNRVDLVHFCFYMQKF